MSARRPPKVKTKQKELNTENDYIEAADNEEKSIWRWRLGDPEKAVRFYRKAEETYNACLKRYPRSFDLAYNKAALQLRLSQDTHLLCFVEDVVGFKRAVVQSHREVLQLNGRDTNALFNTAQALCSLAEELDDDIESEKEEAISLLQEAIELFSSCLAKQEAAYLETQELTAVNKATVSFTGDGLGAKALDDSQISSTEETAQIVITISPEDLIDSALASLEALEQLTMLYAEDGREAIENLNKIANLLVYEKLPHLLKLIDSNNQNLPKVEGISRRIASYNSEIILAIASWQASLCIAEYCCSARNLHSVLETINGIFSDIIRASEQDKNRIETLSVHVSRAEALLSLARRLGEQIGNHAIATYDSKTEIRLKCLIEAQHIFESHIRSTTEKRARMLIECGDCCLQKLQLKYLQGLPESLQVQLADQITEARDWYRKAREASTVPGIKRGTDGSISIGVIDETEDMIRTEAIVKEAVSMSLESNPLESNIPDKEEVNSRLSSIKGKRTEQILRGMVDDRLVDGTFEALKSLLQIFIN